MGPRTSSGGGHLARPLRHTERLGEREVANDTTTQHERCADAAQHGSLVAARCDLDGQIDLIDYGQIDGSSNANLASPGYFNGDFNYDGLVDLLDYGIIDGNINTQGAAFPTGTGIGSLSAVVVPEPMFAGWLTAVACGFAIRRRKRSRQSKTFAAARRDADAVGTPAA